jgi:phage tail sheath protein FI
VNATEDVKAWADQLTSSSYGVLDSGALYVYDKYNDTFRYIVGAGAVAGLCAFTDDVQDPWFSPAGFNRGQLRGVTKLAFNPRKAERDTLYKARVNPLVSFPGQGTILFGDKTAQARPSAFDRINVRRLFITLEKAISTAAKFQLFELNDQFTRAQFRNLVEPFLRDVQGRRGMTDFLVVCDETNNTPQVIDTNRFVADIYIKPARSINFITLNFIAVRTGVEFSEIAGQ